VDEQPLVPGRSCGTCTMCCWLLRIEELAKPEHTLCRHCEAGAGCTIYDARPEACREFYCGWRALPFAGAHWFPPDCGMMIYPMAAEKRLAVHVDPARPDAWRAEPFHADLRQWAVVAERMGMQLTVAVGRRIIAILPHEDVDLGLFEDDDQVVYDREVVDGRTALRARKVSSAGG
jgi:hypothetical protein